MNGIFVFVYRVDKGHQFAAAADQTRQHSLKCAEISPCHVDVANTVVNIDRDDTSVTAQEKPFMNTGVLGDNGQKECEYSASLKIDSSFVSNSLVPDVFTSEDSHINIPDQLGSDKKIQVSSGIIHVR